MSDEVILQILRRSPQGFTPFEILDQLLALPQYQGCSESSIFSELLPVLHRLRDSQVVAHVSPHWLLVKVQENTSEKLSDEFKDEVSFEEINETEAPVTLNGSVQKEQSHTQLEINFSEESANCVNNVGINLPIELLNLSVRSYNSLKRGRINTIKELQRCSDKDLLSIRNFGQHSLTEVRSALANFQPPPQLVQTQEEPLLPEWISLPAMQISTRKLAVSPSLHKIISKYLTVAQLIYEFEGESIVLDAYQCEEIKDAITPFQALRNASQNYLDWLASLSKYTVIEVLTKHQWTPDKLKELSLSQIMSKIPYDAREITYQAIISGRIPSKIFTTITTLAEEVEDWLYPLNDTYKFVLKQRLGWESGNQRTMEDIGQEKNLSRERVRQIESKARRKLNDIQGTILPKLQKVAIETLRSAGCICTLEDWCEAIAQVYPPGEIHLPSVISWIVDFISEIRSIEIYNKKFFYIEPLTKSIFLNIQAHFKEFWSEEKISDRSQLHQVILPQLPEDILNPEQVADTLIKNLCYEPIPGVFSAEEWNISDYAYYVLHEAGQPLHFSEIGQRIKQLKPDWKADNIERSAQGLVERHLEIIRSGSGIYGLREWGTIEYSHFREVLLDYLSKQPLPVDAEDIYAELSKSYVVTYATVTMNLAAHPNLFKKFGRSNFYGVAGRRYELPDENLLSLLIEKLKDAPVRLLELEQNTELRKYDFKTLLLYLNVSPLFCQTASNKERKFALSIEGKHQYEPGDGSKIVADIFNQICEPLHPRDFPHFVRNYYAYPPGESAFWRILTEDKHYIPIAEAIFIPRDWMSDETLSSILEDLDTEKFREIILFTLGSKRQQLPTDVLFDWLNFCYRNRFFYRGSLVYAQINLSELSDKKAKAACQIGKVCQRNGDTSVLAIGQDANSEEVERTLRLDWEELRQQAQSGQRTPSKGLASKQDGNYRVRYVAFDVEVHLTKWGGTDNPCAKVLKVLVNGELFDPQKHNLIPTNTAPIEERRDALQKLYEATLTAYAQVEPYLQVAIGQRPAWGNVGYRNMERITELEMGDFA